MVVRQGLPGGDSASEKPLWAPPCNPEVLLLDFKYCSLMIYEATFSIRQKVSRGCRSRQVKTATAYTFLVTSRCPPLLPGQGGGETSLSLGPSALIPISHLSNIMPEGVVVKIRHKRP